MDPRELPVYAALDELGIAYERFAHDPAMTMHDCDIFDAGKNAAHCKNLFLANRQGTQFYLLLMMGDKPFKTKDVSAQLGVARMSFATQDQLMRVLQLTPGAVTPMGLVNDAMHSVHVLIDSDIVKWDKVIVHPNVNTASIILRTDDLLRFLEAQKNKISRITLPLD